MKELPNLLFDMLKILMFAIFLELSNGREVELGPGLSNPVMICLEVLFYRQRFFVSES